MTSKNDMYRNINFLSSKQKKKKIWTEKKKDKFLQEIRNKGR